MKMKFMCSGKIGLLSVGLLLTSSLHAETFTFWHGQTGKLGDAVQELCRAYNASQDKHVITCVSQGGNEALMQKTIASYRTKNNPEIILGFDAGTLDLMLSGAIIPVEELAARHNVKVDWNNYIPGVKSYYESSKGKVYAQPFNASTVMLFSNAEALKKAGIEHAPETWEQFDVAIRKLKQSGHDCPFSTDGHPWRYLEEFSAVQGEPIATHGNGYTSINSEYVFDKTSHLRMMKDLFTWRNDGLAKLNPDTKAGNYTAAFTSGECAMSLVSSGAYGQAYTALKDTTPILISKMPIYEGTTRHNTIVGGGAIWVMQGHSEEKYKAVLDFLDYVRQPDVQVNYVKNTGYLPVTQSAYQQIMNSAEADSSAFATVKVGVASLNELSNENTKGIRLGFYVQFREIWLEETQKAFTGKQTMEQAIAQAKQRGNQLLERFARTYKNHDLP